MFTVLLATAVFGLGRAAFLLGFMPRIFLAGGWQDQPLSWLSPLASAFLARDLLSGAFNLVFLLIAGRFVEKALRPVGLGLIFVAGAYGGALARLILTPGSLMPSAGADAALFAVIGAYFMLYGVPSAIPISRAYSRSAQVGILAAIWMAFQIAFAIIAGGFELSVTIVEPLGGLAAGVALARPILAWSYRKA